MLIHNGDHAEFEIEHRDTRPEDRPDWPLPSSDPRDWAAAFIKIQTKHGNRAPDEEIMLSWFSNAMWRGMERAREEQFVQHNASFFGRWYLRSIRWSNTLGEWRFQCGRKVKSLFRPKPPVVSANEP